MNASKAEGTASEMAGEAKGKAAELKVSPSPNFPHLTANVFQGEAKGKAEEIKGKM